VAAASLLASLAAVAANVAFARAALLAGLGRGFLLQSASVVNTRKKSGRTLHHQYSNARERQA
jgi:hypothetical protein